MDELKEYLSRSKLERNKSLNKAARFIKTLSKSSGVKALDHSFPSVSSKRFHEYSSKVEIQLKSMFYPKLNELQNQKKNIQRPKSNKRSFKPTYLNFSNQPKHQTSIEKKQHPEKRFYINLAPVKISEKLPGRSLSSTKCSKSRKDSSNTNLKRVYLQHPIKLIS